MPFTILIVDDEREMCLSLSEILRSQGFEAIIANSGEAALKTFEKDAPDLILLDLMMPDMDGYTVCQRIREFSQVPIIMVTARGDDKEKVAGLNIGADDYVTKPFSAGELAARVRAVLRRIGSQDRPVEAVFHHKDLTVDFASHRVMVRDNELRLTSTEYRLLSYISLNAGRVITPDQLLHKVWGEEYIGAPHLLQCIAGEKAWGRCQTTFLYHDLARNRLHHGWRRREETAP
jgi:DNA-binding response OmpR family regulator